jgi:hypothetical protein
MRLNVRHGTNFLNAFALDPDGDVFEISPFADIQQLGDFHHDRGCFWRLRIRFSEDRRRASRKNQAQQEHSLFMAGRASQSGWTGNRGDRHRGDRRREDRLRKWQDLGLRSWSSPRQSFSRLQFQFIQFEEFLNDGLGRFFHFRVRTEEDRTAFVQKHDPLGQLLG